MAISTDAGVSADAVLAHLAGITATLTGDFAPFMEYARVHMAPLHSPAGATPRIRAHLNWYEGPAPHRGGVRPPLAGWDRLDRDLYRRGPELAWFRIDDFPDLHLRLKWDGDALAVEGDYYHHLGRTPARDWVRRVLYSHNLPRLQRRRFTTLLYYLVYYPLFWWLEHHGIGHPIHAGGVEMPGGLVVLAGPSGVGKSTLVTGLAAAPGARLLSDTFLLHHGAQIMAVPEPLLLDRWSRGWLGDHARLLQPIPHRYSLDRDGFHWPDSHLSSGGRARVLVFSQRAASHYVKPVTASAAQGRIRAGDLIVNDVRRYWAFASILEVMDPNPLVLTREQSLAELVTAVPAYEIGLTADVAREDIVALIERLLGDAA